MMNVSLHFLPTYLLTDITLGIQLYQGSFISCAIIYLSRQL
jgi:hypothetical protein